MGSSAPESTPSQTTSSPQLPAARREESPSAQDNDHEAEGHTPAAAMAAVIDNEPIEEMGGADDFDHEGDDAGVDIDFGDLEMFDSNASQLPFLTQEPQSVKSEEPVFPASSESTKRDKTKKKKKKKSPLQTAEVAGDQPTEANLDVPNGLEDATTDMYALDLTPVPSTQKKKKRKTADSADGKRHKKRKGLDDGDTTASQQTQDEDADTRNTATSFLFADKNASSQPLDAVTEDDQMSPSIALARRRSQTRSRENSVSRAQVAPMAPMAVDIPAQESTPEGASKSQEAATENHEEDRDVEDLAREAWREHVNSQSGNASAASKVEPGPQNHAEAEEQPDATPRRRSTRTKKPVPSSLAQETTETPAKKNRRVLEELPSPSANTPKPRARSTRATQKPRKAARKTSNDDVENEESEKTVRRASNLGENFTQGRFTDAEFDGINQAIETFRNEYGLTQVQVNEVNPWPTMSILCKCFSLSLPFLEYTAYSNCNLDDTGSRRHNCWQ